VAVKKNGRMADKNTPAATGSEGILAIIFPGGFLAATLYWGKFVNKLATDPSPIK